MFLFGITKGQIRKGSAGATRRTITMGVAEKGATLNDHFFPDSPSLAVLWLGGTRGVQAGLARPETARVTRGRDLPWGVPAGMSGHAELSTSRGDCYYAAIINMTEPVCVVWISGFQSDWRLIELSPSPDGVVMTFDGTPAEYRALHTLGMEPTAAR